MRASWLKLGAGAAASAVLMIGASSVIGLSAAAKPRPGARDTSATLSRRQLRRIALQAARRSGDSSPRTIEAVRTTHAEALSLTEPGAPYGGLGPRRTPVYLIVMTGNFTAYHASIPPGAPIPTGSVMTLIVDPHGRGLDGGLNNNPKPQLWRAGKVIWLGGALEASGGCPLTDHPRATSSDPRTRTTLVPGGPTGLTLCRYRGLNPQPKRAGTLLRSRRIDNAAKIAQLASALSGLPPFPAGGFACPSDDGSEIVARFTYPHAPVDPVVVDLTGCQGVGNGHVERWLKDPMLIRELQKLTRRS